MAISIKSVPPVVDGDEIQYVVSLGGGVDYVTPSDAQALADQLADLGVFSTKAAAAIQSLDKQNQQLKQLVAAPPELVFLRSLVTNALLKGVSHG